MSPVFLWKLVFSFLDTLKQSVLERDKKKRFSSADLDKNIHCSSLHNVHCSVSNSHLAGVTGFPQFPATATTTAAYERWVAAQHDVQDDSKAPQVTALVINCGLLTEGLNHLRCHVLC